ncbi:MAG: trypsin-like peptidase domain-containing protein [Phycisphaerae bacterium]|jgi:serine protease Do
MRWLGILQIPTALLLVASSSTHAGDAQDRPPPRRDLRRTPVVEAYERARESVVNISATEKMIVQRKGMDIFGDLFAVPTERSTLSVGSGVVIHEDGYVATNAHVVSAGADLVVTFTDGTAHDADVVGRDTPNDLAVIKVENTEPLQPIAFGRSDDLMIGEQTIAVGNPIGLQNTVTTGVISALHRDLQVAGHTVYRDLIQTDASINPGNSGGPLLNVLGELVGINMALRTDAQNIGFAIPVDRLREILPDILDSEKHNRFQLGMRVDPVAPARVIDIRDGSPAAIGGLRVGDVIEQINGQPIGRGVDYYVTMLNHRPGDEISVDVRRDRRLTRARVTLEPIPHPDGAKLARARLGLIITDAKDAVARQFQRNPRRKPGVIVVALDPSGPAEQADIRPGDLLVSMGSRWVLDVDHVGALLAGTRKGEPVDIGFRRKFQGRLYDGEVHLHAR